MTPTYRSGVQLALAAYIMWGFAPLYFLLVEFATPTEIIAHRIFWSMLMLLGLLRARSMLRGLVQLTWREYGGLFCSGLLLGINWWTFIWALQNERVLETSVGYYINPLISVALGVVFLGERLRPIQWVAVSLAGLGVLNEILNVGVVPYVALVLAVTFGLYGLVRKRLALDSIQGLALESMLLLPLALIALGQFALSGTLQTFDHGVSGLIFLALTGVVTSAPLLCFTAAANRLPLVVVGMIQYLAPTITMLLAIFFYGEPFGATKAITFGFVWLGIVVFSIDAWSRQLRGRDVFG